MDIDVAEEREVAGGELLRIVFEHSNDAIFVIDPEADRILDANPRAVEMLGYPRDRLLGMRVSDVHPDEMPALQAFAGSVLELGHGWTDELSCLTRGGCRLPAEISASVVDSDGGRLMVAMVRDISRRKQAELALEEARRRLEDSNRDLKARVEDQSEDLRVAREKLSEHERLAAVGEFAASVVHEIRNPLSTLSLVLEHLHKAGLEPGLERRVALAFGESRRLTRLLEEILAYAKPHQCEYEQLDLGELACSAVESLREEHGDRLLLDSQTGTVLTGDPDKLRQVMLNLVGNALEASPAESSVSIAVRRGADDAIELSVQNWGAAIPSERLPRLTEPFYSTKRTGTGLGLAIVKRIVESHGGVLSLRSSEAEGTVARVVLPA